MKKTLSLILSVALVLSLFAGLELTAYAATSTYTSGDLSISLDTSTGVFTVSGTGKGADYSTTSSFFSGTHSTSGWYLLSSYIKSVVIEEGVENIGSYWFYKCTNLTSITLPDSLDTIGNNAFEGCTGLTSIVLPSTVSYCWSNAFKDCTGLKYAELLGKNLASDYSGTVAEGFFSGCTALEEVFISSDYTGIGKEAFSGCTSLKGVVWSGDSLTSIGDSAFSSASSATIVGYDSISSSTGSVTYQAFETSCGDSLSSLYDPSTRKITFSGSGDMSSTPWSIYHYFINSVDFSQTDDLYNIATSAFSGATALADVDFGSTLSNVGWGAFQNCTALESITLPNTVETVWGCAFENCTSASGIYFAQDGTVDLKIKEYAFKNISPSSNYWINIPANCTEIGDQAFYNSTALNYIVIASPSVTIGTDAFGDGSGYWMQFLGVTGSGVKDYVDAGKTSGYNWKYYCINHTYVYSTVEPTCTEKGYDLVQCNDCDLDDAKSNYTDATGHNYSYTGSSDGAVLYECSKCGSTDISIDAVSLLGSFIDAVTTADDEEAYKQSNYDGKFDVNKNGYINAKDYSVINGIIQKIDTTDKETTIDTSTTYQTIEGFGASAAWWAQSVGGWDNIDEIMQLLYSKESGAGLNIYRYNLGTGSADDDKIYNTDRRTEGFLQSDGTYDWTKDANAQKALASAQKANSDLKVTLFSNSAPVSMTKNGYAFCSSDKSSNLDESNYDAFAQFVVMCAEHFIDEGYDVTEVSPINEPEWSWNAGDDGTASQEGCYFTDEEARTFYNDYMIPALQSSEKLNGTVSVSPWESGQLNHSTYFSGFLNNMFSSATKYKSNNENIRTYSDSLCTHSYWASQSDREEVASTLSGNVLTNYYSSVKKVRCTEYCQMTNDSSSGVYGLIQEEGTTNGMTIEYGLALADIMYQDLTILNAVEWDWWVACGTGIYPDSLIYINNNDHSDVQTSKRLWVMGNYARFIDEGATRIEVSTGSAFGANLTTDKTYSWTSGSTTYTDKNNYIEQSAYLNPDGTVVIVYINNSDTNEYTSFASSGYASFESFVTDADRDLEKYQSGSISNTVSIPAKSVTTVVLTPAE